MNTQYDNPFTNQTYVLSGLYQCASLVHQIATEGKCSFEDYKSVIRCLFITQFKSIEDTFEDTKNLKSGLLACKKHLSLAEPNHSTMNINRYVTSLLGLESKLKSNHEVIQQIVTAVSQSHQYHSNLNESMETLINNFAGIYTDFISPNAPQIIIKGSQEYLKNSFNANKIRACLLAGFRLSILWQQLGGRRWNLLLMRKKILTTCNMLLSKMA